MSLTRTPTKQITNDAEPQSSSIKTATQPTSVRRSIGEWEATKSDLPPVTKATLVGPAKTKQKPTMSQEARPTARRASIENSVSPPKQAKYADRTAEARACLLKAKLHLSNSRNLKTDIKQEVTAAIDRLYNLVKELEEERKGRGVNGMEKLATQQRETVEKGDIVGKLEEHTKMILENNRKLDELRIVIEKQHDNLDKITYANATARTMHKGALERGALHSLVVTSEVEADTGEVVLDKVREAIDAKEGWVKVTRVRRARDRKIVMSCHTKEEREKVKDRLVKAGKQLIVEDVQNKDPLIILKDVLLINSDEDVLKAMRNQNRAVFHDLDERENRISIKYRQKARNPHTGHIVMSASPVIWRRVIDAGALFIDLQRIRVADQSPLVQCSRCLAYGHSKRFCMEAVDLCSHCGGPHMRTECTEWPAGMAPSCRNCNKAGLERAEHNAFSQECPVRQKWDTLARSAIAYC